MNIKVRFALGLTGMSETDIEQIDKALPAFDRLLADYKTIEPVITKAYPDILAVIPALQGVINFMKQE